VQNTITLGDSHKTRTTQKQNTQHDTGNKNTKNQINNKTKNNVENKKLKQEAPQKQQQENVKKMKQTFKKNNLGTRSKCFWFHPKKATTTMCLQKREKQTKPNQQKTQIIKKNETLS